MILRREALRALGEVRLVLVRALSLSDGEGHLQLSKGTPLSPREVQRIAASGPETVEVVALEPGELHEDEAAARIATAVAGPNVAMRDPVASQVKLLSAVRGVVAVDAGLLCRINSVTSVCVFTLYDGQAVESGQQVAGAKVGPLVVPAEVVSEVEAICASSAPVLEVRPFRPLRVAVFNQEPLEGVKGHAYQLHITRRIEWLGGYALPRGFDMPVEAAEITAILLDRALAADLAIITGTNSLDPLDGGVQGLLAAGGTILRQGIPAHPGSTYWVGAVGGLPVLGVGSCGMLSDVTAFDIILARHFAGLPVDREFLAGLGHGGLLTGAARFRFPRYGAAGEISGERDGDS